MRDEQIASKLFGIASLQQGFFTSKQAKEAGYSDSRFPYHVRKGHWIREGRGIYRLANFPEGDRPDLVYWTLWSCNRSGEPQGVFSHETALAIHDLSDIMPATYHLTVPIGFRRFHKAPAGLQLHFANLDTYETEEHEGYRVTSAYRTLHDVLASSGISEEIVVQAFVGALEKGSVSRSRIDTLLSGTETERAKRMRQALDQG